ncbi:MAG: glycosyltransferase [Bdellovibrionales bacterium]|nr:glycosyltransferase [Bdellovibrionales bacterium]
MLYRSPLDLPVLLLTYNRPAHTKQVLDALRLHGVRNLSIWCDAPKVPEHEVAVQETLKLVQGVNWTNAKVTCQEHNRGLAASIREGVDRLLNEEDFVIVLEDDCVPEQYFFRYMYEAYVRYRENPKVFGVSGYTVQLPKEIRAHYQSDAYFFPRIGSWGWGTWKAKWSSHERDLNTLLQKCQAANIDLEQGGSDIPHTILGLLNGSVKDVWTIHWVLSVYLNRGVYLYPTSSHIRNIGMDGSGVHCGPTDRFDTEVAVAQPKRFPTEVSLDRKIYSCFRSFYDVPGTSNVEQSYERVCASLNGANQTENNSIVSESHVTVTSSAKPLITHVIEAYSLGGAGRAMLSIMEYTARMRPYHHRIVSLRPVEQQEALSLAKAKGFEVCQAPSEEGLHQIVSDSDIVHLHWWNNPAMEKFLRSGLPPCRLVGWFHVGGHRAPQRVTPQIVEFVDMAVPCSPYTARCPAILDLSPEQRLAKVRMAYGCADFARLENFASKPHKGFRVGYVGTLNFMKMHPDFVKMSAFVNDPTIEFHLWGGGGCEQILLEQARALSLSDRFFIHGYSADIVEALSQIDVFGYPLCEDTYAASEVILQEVMYAGVVPVVFPYGGVQDLVIDGFTGIVVRSALEYAQALQFLKNTPKERERLARNAKEYARQVFGAENAAVVFDRIYGTLLEQPKRNRSWRALPTPTPYGGATIFCETLGEEGDDFWQSLSESADDSERCAAEKRISEVSTLFRTGGILNYLAGYPNDPYLHLWAGLASLGAGFPEQATSHFSNAIERGFGHWRALWYLGIALRGAGATSEAEKCFTAVRAQGADIGFFESSSL